MENLFQSDWFFKFAPWIALLIFMYRNRTYIHKKEAELEIIKKNIQEQIKENKLKIFGYLPLYSETGETGGYLPLSNKDYQKK